MKLIPVFIFFSLLTTACLAQGTQAEAKFHEGSNLYINGNPQGALAAVQDGLRADPRNQKLQALKKLLEDQKKEEEKKKKEEQQKNQDKKNQENKDKKEQENKDKQDQQKKEQEQKQKEQQEREQKEKQQKEREEKEKQEEEKDKKDFDPKVEEKLKEMKIDPEKAKMLLEAMRNQEIQYLQQRKREQTKRRDPSKPDW